tara:strand:+ start:2311 stop:3264 length:954 start_codon:yes stop_codon:yes gene_type:complete
VTGYNTIKGLKVKYLSADPSNLEDAQVWYNSTTAKLRVANILGTGSWASGGAVNTARPTASAGTQAANVIFGGNPPAGATAAVEEYNGSSWTEVNDLPATASNLSGTGTQTAALSFGGYPDVNATNEYDGTNWTTGGTLNTGRELLSQNIGTQTAAMGTGGEVRSPAAPSLNSETYNGTAWSEGNNLNTARYGVAGSGTTSAALAAGGNPSTAVAEEYDGTSWSNVTSRPYAGSAAMSSGIQTAALNYGGNPASALTTTVSYDGTNWSAEAAMATGRDMGGGSAAGTSSSALASTGAVTPATEEYTVPLGTVSITTS